MEGVLRIAFGSGLTCDSDSVASFVDVEGCLIVRL